MGPSVLSTCIRGASCFITTIQSALVNSPHTLYRNVLGIYKLIAIMYRIHRLSIALRTIPRRRQCPIGIVSASVGYTRERERITHQFDKFQHMLEAVLPTVVHVVTNSVNIGREV